MDNYALHLADDGRILYATFSAYAAQGDVPADTLPQGDITDYRLLDGRYVYDPLPPAPDPAPQPDAQQDTDAMLIDHEFRLTLLELGLTEFTI